MAKGSWGRIKISLKWLNLLKLARFCSSLTVRFAVIVIFIGVTAWLLYDRGWQTFATPVDLPAGVALNPVAINEELVTALTQQQAAQSTHRLMNFGAASVVKASLP